MNPYQEGTGTAGSILFLFLHEACLIATRKKMISSLMTTGDAMTIRNVAAAGVKRIRGEEEGTVRKPMTGSASRRPCFVPSAADCWELFCFAVFFGSSVFACCDLPCAPFLLHLLRRHRIAIQTE